MTELDPDRALALSYVPAGKRDALRALWRLDAALGAVLASGREPMLSQIKLTWWRDSLEKLDREPAPAEPMLRDVAARVVSRSVRGEQLARMEEGWAVLLGHDPLTPEELETYAVGRGALLFRYSSSLLGYQLNDKVKRAGEGWALADLARHSNPVDAAAALAAAGAKLADVAAQRWPVVMRPLGMLAMLAKRDVARGPGLFERQGSPARMARMIGHRLTGR